MFPFFWNGNTFLYKMVPCCQLWILTHVCSEQPWEPTQSWEEFLHRTTGSWKKVQPSKDMSEETPRVLQLFLKWCLRLHNQVHHWMELHNLHCHSLADEFKELYIKWHRLCFYFVKANFHLWFRRCWQWFYVRYNLITITQMFLSIFHIL